MKGYLTDEITARTVSFLERHAKEPFFVDVAFNATHWPFQGPGLAPEKRYVDFEYQPYLEPDGTCTGVFAHGVDVTAAYRVSLEDAGTLRLTGSYNYTTTEIVGAIATPQQLVLGTQMERHIAKRLGVPCAVISSPIHVQDVPARYSPQMGFEGANVLFDTWVHPLMMGLEEHLLHMFREDFEFHDGAAASHLGHGQRPPVAATVSVPPEQITLPATSAATATPSASASSSRSAASSACPSPASFKW